MPQDMATGNAAPRDWERHTPGSSGPSCVGPGASPAGPLSLSGTVYFDFLLWDERIYHEWASRIADGTFASKSVYEFPPLFAYLAAALYKLLGPDPVILRFLNVGSASSPVHSSILSQGLAGRKVGLLAALLACLYKPLIFYSVVPLKEMFSVCLFALMTWLLLSLNGKPVPGKGENRRGRALSSAAAARPSASPWVLINVRPNAVILLPLIP